MDVLDLAVLISAGVCLAAGAGGALDYTVRDSFRRRRAVRRIHAEPRRRSREDYWRDTL